MRENTRNQGRDADWKMLGTEATEKISREARKSKDKEIEKSEWEAAEKQNEKLRRK